MRYLTIFLCLFTTASNVPAQTDSATARWPDIGARVRVWTVTGGAVTGDLVNVRGDTLAIRTADRLSSKMAHIPAGKVTFIPGSSVTRIEVSRGRAFSVEHAVAGAAIGAAAGLALAAAADVTAEAMFGEGAGDGVDYSQTVAVGAIAGAVLGASTPGDRWETTQTPPAPTYAPRAQQGRFRLRPRLR
jgi:hypothetical protein